MKFNFKKNTFFIRLFHWEYWPFALVYGPILPVYFWYALRAKSFFFFSTSNPSIKNAGFEMESKFETDNLIPQQFRPSSIYFEPNTAFNIINQKITEQHIIYPLIIKPDIGGKGVGVKKVNSETELINAVKTYPVPFLIQSFVSFKNEIGLFFVKMPDFAEGKITGIVRKEFLKVTGDGISTILELLQKNSRHILQIPILKKMLGSDIYKVIDNDVTQILVPYGNHARGCLFLDDTHLASLKLEALINKVCNNIEGFYYGRMDIKFDLWEDFEEGKNFSIIELNGTGSEPTHIYDPKHSLFFAWKEIITHWKLLWQVSTKSKAYHNLKYMSLKEGMKMFAERKEHEKKCINNFH